MVRIIFFLALSGLTMVGTAWAQHGRGGHGPGPGGHHGGPRVGVSIGIGGAPYRPAPYYPGPYHHHGGVRFLLAPPPGHVVLSVGGTRYYRHGGIYYRSYWYDDRWVYYEVPPPAGVIVTTLPPDPDRVVVNGQVYYRNGATYYVEAPRPKTPDLSSTTAAAATNGASVNEREALTIPNAASDSALPAPRSTRYSQPEPIPAPTSPQYVVVAPPVGAMVDKLPDGALTQNTGGAQYFHVDGVYYLPVSINGQTKYVVVEKPAGE